MTGVDRVRDPALHARVARIFDGAPFVADIGLELVGVGSGWCETALPLGARHLQHGGVAHAGVTSTLADDTAGAAAQTVCAPGQTVVTLIRCGASSARSASERPKTANFVVLYAESCSVAT